MSTFKFDFENVSYEDEYSQVALYNSYPQSPANEFEKSFESLGIFNTANKARYQNDGLDDLINPHWMEELCQQPETPVSQHKKSLNVLQGVDLGLTHNEVVFEGFGSAIKYSIQKNCWNIDTVKDDSTSTINEVNTVDSPLNETNFQNPLASNEVIQTFKKSALKFEASPTNSQQDQQAIVLIDLAGEDDESMEILDDNQDAWDPKTQSYRLIMAPAKPAKKIRRKQKKQGRN